jgi:hypothetical protein
MGYHSTMTNETLADTIIERLNDIARTDPVAMDALIKARVPCNKAMAEHPTVQVTATDEGGIVGILGLLNGIVGVIPDGRPRHGWGYIAAEMDDRGAFVRFVRTDLHNQPMLVHMGITDPKT